MTDDSALLRGAKRLNLDALTTLFDTYAPAVYKYALRLCHDPIIADNIVGNVFTQLLEQFVTGKGPVTNLRSYIYKIAHCLVVDRTGHNESFSIQWETKSSQARPEEHMPMDKVASALKNELSELQRHVIILRFLEDFSLRETAAILNISINYVKVIQNRGMAKLRKCLG